MPDDAAKRTVVDRDDSYAGLFGAFPYAFRSSDSLLFRSYVGVAALLALGITLLFGLAVVVLLGATAGVTGGSFTFSRAFFIFVGLLVVAPLLAPVLFVARRHRRGNPDSRYDARLAALGYLFVGSLYVALVVSTPVEQQETVSGALAPVVEFLYGLPRLAGLLLPSVVAVLIWVVGRTSE